MNTTHDWFTHNIPHWERILATHKGKPNLHYLEIGTFEGRATMWLLENILTGDKSDIVTIDTFTGSQEHNDGTAPVDFTEVEARARENLKDAIDARKCFLMKGKSHQILIGFHGITFDFIYIDGDHTAKGVLTDAVYSWNVLNAGGIMIFDDYEWNAYPETPHFNPKMGIEAFIACYQEEITVIHKGYQIAIQKKI
jgi:predicted O-methyltransferase YrrM